MSSAKDSLSIMHLSAKDCALIMDNCFTGLFVTDGTGRIIYVNHSTLDTLGLSASEILGMDIYQLRDLGFTSYSSTAAVLDTKKRTISTYQNKAGKTVATVSTPVYDDYNNIAMVVTYSQELSSIQDFQNQLLRVNTQLKKYRTTIDYIGHTSAHTLIAEDPSMQNILRTLETVASTDGRIMLYGESGSGKEILANYIYQHSSRKDGIFIPINCAAIPESLIESELFGYEKGAFTGATRSKAGIFELANGGTIFMDEIAELPLSAQSKLLRVLENGEFFRIGSSEVQKTDVRIIGATNRNLIEMITAKEFRADLYYRLNVIPITIPPLRDRPRDLEALTDLFLKNYNRKHGKNRVITDAMRTSMRNYSWPGNIRELRNAIEHYVITGSESALSFDNDSISEHYAEFNQSTMSILHGDFNSTLHEVTAEFERQYIRATLHKFNGNVSQTAKALGISRSTFYEKLKDNPQKS